MAPGYFVHISILLSGVGRSTRSIRFPIREDSHEDVVCLCGWFARAGLFADRKPADLGIPSRTDAEWWTGISGGLGVGFHRPRPSSGRFSTTYGECGGDGHGEDATMPARLPSAWFVRSVRVTTDRPSIFTTSTNRSSSINGRGRPAPRSPAPAETCREYVNSYENRRSGLLR